MKTASPIVRLSGTYGATTASLSLGPRSRTGLRAREKKALPRLKTEYLTEALGSFTGYLAADELYDGPYCVLSIVDNHSFRRLAFQVLDHAPTQKDIQAFFMEFKGELDSRGLKVLGVTTDGSNLYPEPLSMVWPGVPHQVCVFHVLKELTKQVLRAVAKERKALVSGLTKGAKDPESRKRRKAKADLFEHRTLFVKKELTEAERKLLAKLMRGSPRLRAMRQIMEEAYRLFDRRYRMETALKKLAKLRTRVKGKGLRQTLGKLFSETLEKALTFLDNKELESTSNAVERGNRRHRKMQKMVYRTRSLTRLKERMAMDLLRESESIGRHHSGLALHQERARALNPL